MRVHEVVAAIDVAVMLHGQTVPAGLSHGTHSAWNPAPAGEGGVEHLDEDTPHIALAPLVEDVAQELPVTLRADAPGSQPGAFPFRRNDDRPVVVGHVHDMFHSR